MDEVASQVTSSLERRRLGVVRAGVVVCTVLAAALGLARLDEALGLYDFRADGNAALTYLERAYGDGGVVPDRSVVAEARARMPERAEYRVVIGPGAPQEGSWHPNLVADFLRYFLAPRRQTDSRAAEWVFCLGCDLSALGEDFAVLARGEGRFSFGRLGG